VLLHGLFGGRRIGRIAKIDKRLLRREVHAAGQIDGVFHIN